MIGLFQKIISALLALLIGLLQSIGIPVSIGDFTPEMEIIGHLDNDGTNQVISGNVNTGDITSTTHYAAGIVAYSEGGGDFTNNTNSGNIKGVKDCGGIVGRIEDDRCTFTDNVNGGAVSSSNYQGHICGYDGRSKTTY